MNRREFFHALGAIAVAQALPIPLVREITPFDDHLSGVYAKRLARSMLETKETLTANILNRAFTTSERMSYGFADWRGTHGTSGA